MLRHALEKLRTRDGLTHSRLESSRSVEAAPLLSLAAVRRYAAVHNVDLAQAALEIITECVRDSLYGSDRVVADSVLALRVFSEAYTRQGIDEGVNSALCSDSLGRRRNTLLSNWHALHKALGVTRVEPPSDRALRGTVERSVLEELARQLVRREQYSLGSNSVVMPSPHEGQSPELPMSRPGRVIVVGGAVMDAKFRTKVLPQLQTSTDAFGFDLAPAARR